MIFYLCVNCLFYVIDVPLILVTLSTQIKKKVFVKRKPGKTSSFKSTGTHDRGALTVLIPIEQRKSSWVQLCGLTYSN